MDPQSEKSYVRALCPRCNWQQLYATVEQAEWHLIQHAKKVHGCQSEETITLSVKEFRYDS